MSLMYHVTPGPNLPGILAHGLEPRDPAIVRGQMPGCGNPTGVYLYRDLGDAASWATEPDDVILAVDTCGLRLKVDPDNEHAGVGWYHECIIAPIRIRCSIAS